MERANQGVRGLISYEEVARTIQCSVSKVRKWVGSRQLRVVKLGHRIRRVRRQDFEEFLRKRTTR